MSDLFGNHIVGFSTRWLIFSACLREILFATFKTSQLAQTGVCGKETTPVQFLDVEVRNYNRSSRHKIMM